VTVTARPNLRSIAGATAMILALLLVVGGCGGAQPASTIQPPSMATESRMPSQLTPVPGSSTPGPSLDPARSELPQPVCPPPVSEVSPPPVSVAVEQAAPIIATPGSTIIATCTTTSVTDSVGEDPPAAVTANAGDRLTVSVPVGWSILAYEGFDRPAVGEGANVIPQVILPTPTQEVDVPGPNRPGVSVVGVNLAVVSDGGQVVGSVEARFQVAID
jgi:hypothetical protein